MNWEKGMTFGIAWMVPTFNYDRRPRSLKFNLHVECSEM